MKILKSKRKLIFEFENDEKGIMVTTKVKGKLTLNDILRAKQVIDGKLNNGKDKRK